jgi:flagellar hook-basal body complex protein FliE
VIVPAIGGLASNLSASLAEGVTTRALPAQASSGALSANQSSAGLEAGGGAEASAGVEGSSGVEGASGLEGTSGVEATGGGEATSFGSELSSAISSLESTETHADSAAQSLATGTAKDPESAVVTVQDAQMAMDLAAQIRTKATEAAQSIFQTQV